MENSREIVAFIDSLDSLIEVQASLEEEKLAGIRDRINRATQRFWEKVVGKFPGLCHYLTGSVKEIERLDKWYRQERKKYDQALKTADTKRAKQIAIGIATRIVDIPQGSDSIIHFALNINDHILEAIGRAIKFLLKLRIKQGPEAYIVRVLANVCGVSLKLPEIEQEIEPQERDRRHPGIEHYHSVRYLRPETRDQRREDEKSRSDEEFYQRLRQRRQRPRPQSSNVYYDEEGNVYYDEDDED